jgi:xanthine dehydrogenase accessory factor
MISAALARRSQELAAAKTPFVTATVVRAQSPTSVKAGSAALVLGDGTIAGFVGGSCTEQSVRAYSQIALRTGEPVLLRILPDGPSDSSDEPVAEEGAVTVRNPCLSGGAIEVFLEPSVPAPRVLLVGDTPIAAAVVRIGAELDLDIVAVGDDGPRPQAGDLAMIVAAHGRDELDSLRSALEVEVPYVGLVASERRGAGVLADLRGDGVPEDLLGRIDVPAGIAIGSLTPGEIALSILAKVVQARRSAELPAVPEVREVVDPVCGMTVLPGPGTPSLERDGERYYFCCEGCKTKFERASVGG